MSYKFFSNKECEYYPCHKIAEGEEFNCLFCFCPLYSMGEKCGGNFTILGNNIKDCSNCTFPHRKDNYDKVIEKLSAINYRKYNTKNIKLNSLRLGIHPGAKRK